jgi:hypothetical protein
MDYAVGPRNEAARAVNPLKTAPLPPPSGAGQLKKCGLRSHFLQALALHYNRSVNNCSNTSN